MSCSILSLIGSIAATIAIIGGALYAGFQGIWGWVAAGFLALGAQGMLFLVSAALTSYKSCRDSADGSSLCSTANMINTISALRVLLGIASTGYFTGAAVFWNFFGGGPAAATAAVTSAQFACGLAIALLISLLFFALAYKQCRDTPPYTGPAQ